MKHFVILTGDRKETADRVGSALGITDVRSELLPQDKVAELEKILASPDRKGTVAFVGDGINDAPVLARADIGVAMGGMGSDAAMEAADVVLMNDRMDTLYKAMKVATKTKRIVMENIVFALGVKSLIMVLAFLGITSIWFAIFADVGVALLAVLNGIRPLYTKS